MIDQSIRDYLEYIINDENIRMLCRRSGKRFVKKLGKEENYDKEMDPEG